MRCRCEAPTCDASSAPANGGVGDCTSALAAGTTCQPTCNSGYTVSGTSSCSTDGTLTAATCTCNAVWTQQAQHYCSANWSDDYHNRNTEVSLDQCKATCLANSDCQGIVMGDGDANGVDNCIICTSAIDTYARWTTGYTFTCQA